MKELRLLGAFYSCCPSCAFDIKPTTGARSLTTECLIGNSPTGMISPHLPTG